MNMYCGSKSAFGDAGGPTPPNSLSMEDCLLQGVETNARLKALEPWKTFFPDEVVVVAEFSALTQTECTYSPGMEGFATVLCGNSDADGNFPGYDAFGRLSLHLTSADRTSAIGGYVGLATGAGFPTATPQEVHLKPEDV